MRKGVTKCNSRGSIPLIASSFVLQKDRCNGISLYEILHSYNNLIDTCFKVIPLCRCYESKNAQI